MTLSITVGIPTYQRGEILCQTLGPLLARIDESVLEIIVADQLPDHAPAVADRLADLRRDPRLRYLPLDRAGTTIARNRILAAATGDVVVFLDDDVAVSAGLFRRYADVFAGTGAEAVLGQVFQSSHDRMAAVLADTDQPVGAPRYSGAGRWVDVPHYVMGCNHAVLRKAALDVGGYDERFVAAAKNEEGDFFMRLSAAGGQVWYAPECWLIHFSAPSGGARQRLRPLADEWKRSYNDLLWLVRHGRASHTFGVSLWRALRRGPLHKRNVVRFWRQPWAWYAFFLALGRALLGANVVVGATPGGCPGSFEWKKRGRFRHGPVS